jgi:hypothetical protein
VPLVAHRRLVQEATLSSPLEALGEDDHLDYVERSGIISVPPPMLTLGTDCHLV